MSEDWYYDDWYHECRLCLSCKYATGDGSGDYCTKYGMPLFMVKRKFKCKYYEEIQPCNYKW